MPLQRSTYPIASGRRKFHIPGRRRKKIAAPPPPPSGAFPPHIRWDFEESLSDSSGSYTWVPLSGYTPTYVDGRIGDSAINLKRNPSFRLKCPIPHISPFNISSTKNWSITLWHLRKANRDLTLYLRPDGNSSSSYLWRFVAGEYFTRLDLGNYSF